MASALFTLQADVDAGLSRALTVLKDCCTRVRGWGAWHELPFCARNFAPFDAGKIWAVDATHVRSFRYQVIHTTMTVAFDIIPAPATGAIFAVRLTLPAPFRCVPRPAAGTPLFARRCAILQDDGTLAPGFVALRNGVPGQLELLIERTDGANMNPAGAIGVRGQVTFDVMPA